MIVTSSKMKHQSPKTTNKYSKQHKKKAEKTEDQQPNRDRSRNREREEVERTH